MQASHKAPRCAIYTRKSTEEGLDQPFNSLDAQREACEAYIKSQAHESWNLIETAYNDGGFSGGSMERPAVQRLMSDLKQGLIDIVVVYKVDRLTRSLADFAKIVEVLDKHGASFVSVTQQLNSTTSMGRLTLNVLLSFAQFEREVTGERIRDKLRASKAKGLWTGGTPPIGYRVRAKSLEIHESDAKLTRLIFSKFVELCSVTELHKYLATYRLKRALQSTDRGKKIGGYVPSHGSLYHILQNRIYVGDVVHKGIAYPGKHQAIISRALWARSQRVLAEIRRHMADVRRATLPILVGLLYDDKGNAMDRTTAFNGAKRKYRYYTSRPLLRRCQAEVGSVGRVSARWIEGVVIGELERLLPKKCSQCSVELAVPKIADKVVITSESVEIHFRENATEGMCRHLSALLGRISSPLVVPARFTPWNGSAAISSLDGSLPVRTRPNAELLRELACANQFRFLLAKGQDPDLSNLMKACGLSQRSPSEIAKLAFLAPQIQQTLLDERVDPNLPLRELLRLAECASWAKQEQRFSALVGIRD